MLEHSLQDNPTNVYRGKDSRIAGLISSSWITLDLIDGLIANSTGGYFLFNGSCKLSNGELLYALNKGTISMTGIQQYDGSWIIYGTVIDTYDFTEFITLMGGSLTAGVANDAAVISQNAGAINPYDIYISFEVVR